MKKISICLKSIVFLILIHCGAQANDVNQDGQVGVTDAIFALQVAAGGADASAVLHSHHSLDAADGDPEDAVHVDNNGNVGIGTVTPSTRLDIIGGVAVGGNTVIDSSGKWVGDSTGLQGPKGDKGDPGEPGPAVTTVAVCVDGGRTTDGTCTCNGTTVSQVIASFDGTCTVTADTGSCTASGHNDSNYLYDHTGMCCVCAPD